MDLQSEYSTSLLKENHPTISLITALQNTKHIHHNPSAQKHVNRHQYPQAVRGILIHETGPQRIGH